jgi:hypothetical protein
MTVGGNAASVYGVEKSPILASTNRHTMPSNFERNSLKTKDGDPHEVTHFSQLAKSPDSGPRDE